ncbi:hypothetical protein L596_024429 [Steinernema carpocapsae]|uniref:Uncharacterized protein n=1 Tax=Steinernema carpocapsae TaxID=34508 RepID=A0A4U5MH04_STECR|nr:hypothetical protein L596_024429 [Steinernema carpocapsae]
MSAMATATTTATRFLYENVTIGSISTSRWGDCVEILDQNSVIFSARRMGNSVCYRCVTFIFLSQNVLQVAHQNESVCHENAQQAKKSCFDSNLVSTAEGTFLMRTESLREESCGLDGQFEVSFKSKSSKAQCDISSGSSMTNCENVNQWRIFYQNCSFPSFDEELRCLGSWTDKLASRRYVMLYNSETEDYKCGIFSTNQNPGEIEIFFGSETRDCTRIDPSGFNAQEIYRFRTKSDSRSFSPCRFPEWIQGEYDSLKVSNDQLEYIQLAADSVPVSTYCVAVENQRVLVYSETKCGEPLGFHCLWFRPRSQSVLEYKTTSFDPMIPLCARDFRDDKQFEANVWSAVLTKESEPVPCGFEGSFVTPKDLQQSDCYRVTYDCKAKESMKITSSYCDSGTVFDSVGYTCLATWREDDFTFIYAKKSNSNSQKCFVTRTFNGRFFLAAAGSSCPRNFNFTANADTTLVLEPENKCISEANLATKIVPVANETFFDDKSRSSARRFPVFLVISLAVLPLVLQ